jgi:hypothetical protein
VTAIIASVEVPTAVARSGEAVDYVRSLGHTDARVSHQRLGKSRTTTLNIRGADAEKIATAIWDRFSAGRV